RCSRGTTSTSRSGASRGWCEIGTRAHGGRYDRDRRGGVAGVLLRALGRRGDLRTRRPTMRPLRAPFPYFGSKRHAAHLIWQALGDVASYCEPFCGSAAVLLARPGGPGRIETINDLSGHVANFWRSVRRAPDEVARHIDYPVIETDLHARHRWLVARNPELRAGLDADPDWCDPKAAGWWAWIGSRWCDDCDQTRVKLPAIGDTGKAVHAVPPVQ